MKYIATALLTLALTIGVPTIAQAKPSSPCKYEDSNYCVWDAKHMGNGEGRSFWVGRKGTMHFVSHRVAHRMINS